MSGFDLEVLPEAEAEAREAFLWYFDRSPVVADGFKTELFDAVDGLSTAALDRRRRRLSTLSPQTLPLHRDV